MSHLELADIETFNRNRAVFRDPNTGASHGVDADIFDLGMYQTDASSAVGLYYPALSGILSSLRRATFTVGETVIAQTEEFDSLFAMLNLECDNMHSEDKNRFDKFTGTGFGYVRDTCLGIADIGGALTLQTEFGKDYIAHVDGAIAINNQVTLSDAEQDGQSGRVKLNDLFPELNAFPCLPRGWKVHLEWNRNANSYFLDVNTSGGITTAPLPQRPSMALRRVGDADMGKNMDVMCKGYVFERRSVPAVTTPANDTNPLQTSLRFQSATGKLCTRARFFNQQATDLEWLVSKNRCPAFKGEKMQLNVNGSTLIEGTNGIDNPAYKAMVYAKTWKPLNVPTACLWPAVEDASGYVFDDHTSSVNSEFNPAGVQINAFLTRDLRVEYQRLYDAGRNANGVNNAFTMLGIFEIVKAVAVRDGVATVNFPSA